MNEFQGPEDVTTAPFEIGLRLRERIFRGFLLCKFIDLVTVEFYIMRDSELCKRMHYMFQSSNPHETKDWYSNLLQSMLSRECVYNALLTICQRSSY